jgi:hypothetical protein
MGFADNTAKQAVVITKSDSVEQEYSSIYVGGAGVVTIETLAGDSVPFTVPAGGYLNVHCVKVESTGTTATLMVGLND